jgi:cytoskeletal protein CcmA (bactofilin family)
MKIKTIVLMIAVAAILVAPVASAQDTVSSPSVVVDSNSLMNAAQENGSWILIIQQDLSVNEDIVLEGEFENDGELDRKLALYDQDSNYNLTDRYTLEAPSITVKSPNTRFKGGVFVGDVYVAAENFKLTTGFTVEGNIYFENKAAKSTFTIEKGATVTGNLVNNF